MPSPETIAQGLPASPTDDPEVAGVLASHYIPLPATFRFDCCGRRFDGAIRVRKSGGAELLIRGLLGHVPFSAESVEARRRIQAIVDAGKYIRDTDISVDRKRAIYARRLLSFTSRPPPSFVVAAATALALSLKPLCEAVDGRLTAIEKPAA